MTEGNAYDLYELSEAVSAHGEYPSEENAIGKNNYEQYINNDQLAVAEYAAYYFARLQALWDEDNGEMWGIPLHSPLVLYVQKLLQWLQIARTCNASLLNIILMASQYILAHNLYLFREWKEEDGAVK